jgi:hypothetical protein
MHHHHMADAHLQSKEQQQQHHVHPSDVEAPQQSDQQLPTDTPESCSSSDNDEHVHYR